MGFVLMKPILQLSDEEHEPELRDAEPIVHSDRWKVSPMSSFEKKRLPNYGSVLPGGNLVCEFKPAWLKNAPNCGDLNMRLVPEPKRAAKNVKAAKRGKPELVTKPRVVNSYGTVRVFGSTTSANQKYLSIRGSGDFATQIFLWDAYKKACQSAKVPRGRFVAPEVAEWLAGLPQGWSLAERGSVDVRQFRKLFPNHGKAKHKVLACFAGVLGLELGLSDLVKAVGYIERDTYCAECIRCRIADGLASPGEVFGDIRDFNPSPDLANSVDGWTGGFPCQGISGAGHGLGVDDDRSMLVRDLLKCFDKTSAWFAILENVTALLAADRRAVVLFLLEEFARRNMQLFWATTTAKMVGVHVLRPRIFMVACKSDRVHELMKDLKLMSVETMRGQANEVWNRGSKPELSKWLKQRQCPGDSQPLRALGNVVFLKCAQLGVNVIAHEILKQ